MEVFLRLTFPVMLFVGKVASHVLVLKHE